MWELVGKVLFSAVAARSGYVAGKGLYTSYIGSWLGRNANISKMGKWAVVTGATDGLGKSYAFEMARNKLNVVLISRSQDKLKNVSDEIASKYNVQTKIIPVDFTNAGIYDKIANEIKNLEVGVLVNNVGMTYDFPKALTQVSEKHLHELINCNIVSATMMTKLVLEGMQKRDKGLIINMSSIMHLFSSPYLVVYAALKSYLVAFTKGLVVENRNNNVIIQCVIPGGVTTKFSGFRSTNYLITTPPAYVAASMRAAGLEDLTYAHLTHRLQATAWNFFAKNFSYKIGDRVINDILTNFKSKADYRNKKMASQAKGPVKIKEIKEAPSIAAPTVASTTAASATVAAAAAAAAAATATATSATASHV